MKLLQTGKKPPKFPWEGVYFCAYCRSVMRLDATDEPRVYKWEDDQRDGMTVWAHCPVCECKRGLMDFKSTTTYMDNRKHWDAVLAGGEA